MKIVDLQRGELFAFSGQHCRIQVLFGRVWLTETGRLDDVFADAGETIELASSGRVLVEAFGFARIAVATRRPTRSVPPSLTWLRGRVPVRPRRPLESPSPALA